DGADGLLRRSGEALKRFARLLDALLREIAHLVGDLINRLSHGHFPFPLFGRRLDRPDMPRATVARFRPCAARPPRANAPGTVTRTGPRDYGSTHVALQHDFSRNAENAVHHIFSKLVKNRLS